MLPAALPKALLFDLDGTLLDSVPDLAAAIDAMLLELEHAPAGESAVRHWVGNGARVLVERALADALNCAEASLVVEQVDRAHQCFLKHYEQVCAERSQLYPGVREALDRWSARGVLMACVTNKPEQFTGDLLASFGLDHYFSSVISGDTLPVKKPSPEPLLEACRQLGVTAQQAVMVGDSRSDVAAARAAGMPVACVSYGYNHGVPIEQSEPDAVVDSLADLWP